MYLVISYDAEKNPGERLPPEVRAEIALLAPASVTPNSITEEKLADDSVSTNKIQEKAVTGTRIADGAVATEQLALGAVDGFRLAAGAVTGSKVGNGVAKAVDPSGAEIAMKLIPISSTAYASASPDPTAIYFIYSG